VTHGPSQSELTILDTSLPRETKVIGRVHADGAPHDIAFSPNAGRVWVTYWDGRVAAFDASSRRLLLRRRVGELAHHVAVDDRVWITDHEGGKAYVLSPLTGRTLRVLPVGPGAHHVALFGRRAVAVSHDAGTISVFDERFRRIANRRIGRGLHGVIQIVV